jgi:hypothetical protein
MNFFFAFFGLFTDFLMDGAIVERHGHAGASISSTPIGISSTPIGISSTPIG